MVTTRLLLIFTLLCTSALSVSAEYTPVGRKAISAISADFPRLDFIWTSAEGDLDGDGIADLALVAIGWRNGNPQREERLFILKGNPDGSYGVLSVSDEFCRVSKFYNIDIKKNSVFVQAVEYADAGHASSYTMQFRYNASLKDLEFVGEETLDENYNDGSYYRVSNNYLTRTAIHSRQVGKRHKEVKVRLNSFPILRLQGFDCSNRGSSDTTIHIEENFKVRAQ